MKKLLGKLGAIGGALAVTIIGAIVGPMIYERMSSTLDIEYRITEVGELLHRPQGVEKRLQVTFDGKPYKNVSLVRLELFNRSTKPLSEVPIRVHLQGGNATLLGKMLLYPTDQDVEHFAWDKPDISSLDFTARGFNTSWANQPGVTFNLYFSDGKVPEVSLSTPKAGIEFVPFDDAKVLLFKGDAFLFMLGLMMLAMYGLFQLGRYRSRSMREAFLRVYRYLYEKEVANAKEIQVTTAKEISGTRLLTLAAATHAATNLRFFASKAWDHRSYKYIDAALAAADAVDAQRKTETVSTPA